MKNNNFINRFRYKIACKKYFKSLDDRQLQKRFVALSKFCKGAYSSIPNWKLSISIQCLIKELDNRAKSRCSKKRV